MTAHPKHDGEPAAMERELERDHASGTGESLHRRAAEPAPEAIDDRS